MKQFEYPGGIYIIGDVHGDYRFLKNLIRIISNEDKKSLIIHVGDFGCGMTDNSSQILLNCDARDHNVVIYTIRGNHDDPRYFAEGQSYDSLKFIPDYTYEKINGYTFAFIGGATSIDRHLRRIGIDLFEGEELRPGPLKKADVLISHTAPTYVAPINDDDTLRRIVRSYCSNPKFQDRLFHDLCKERRLMNDIVQGIQPDYMYYGHFHSSDTGEEVAGLKWRLLARHEWCKF